MFKLSNFIAKPLFVSLMFFVLSATVMIVLFIPTIKDNKETQQHNIYKTAQYKATQISYELYSRMNRNQALAAYIEQNPDITQEKFDDFVNSILLHDESGVISSMSFAKDFTIHFISPMNFNHKAKGLDLTLKPGRKDALEKSIASGKSYIEGPYELEQEYEGLVSYIPIFAKNNNANSNEKKVIGIASVIIFWERFLKVAGLNEKDSLIDIAIRGKNGTGEDGAIFYGNPALFDKKDIIKIPITLPLGEWVLAAYPKGGWNAELLSFSVVFSFVVALLFSFFIYLNLKFNRQQIQKSESQYRNLVEKSKDIVWVMDMETMTYTYVNEAVRKFTGYTPEEYCKLAIEDTLTPESVEKAMKILNEAFDNLSSKDESTMEAVFEAQILTKWGKVNWIEVSASTTKDEKGNFKEIIGTTRVINNRKKLEEQFKKSEKKFLAITENSNDLIWIVDADSMRLTYASMPPLMYGYTSEELIQLNIFNLFPPETVASTFQLIRKKINQLKSGEISKIQTIFETQMYRKDGSMIWTEVSVTAITDNFGNPTEYVGIMRNIENRKAAERKILNQSEELKKLNAMKDKFFSIVAHDLKNPISSLLNISEFLIDDFNAKKNEAVKEEITMLHYSIVNTYKLLENLLEWSRSQMGSIVYTPSEIPITKILNDCIASLTAQAAAKNISIQLNNSLGECLMNCDFNMIQTVLRNLISNALKFSFVGSTVEIGVTNYSNSHIQISVKDSGIGIDTNDTSKLFRIDEKIISSKGTNDESGTGLGLILCKEFIDKHNCKIWVESKKGKGTTFFFTLPKATVTNA